MVTNTLIGKRVRLVRTTDIHTRLQRGDEGTVTHIDHYGTVFVKWDSGSALGLIEEAGDAYEVVG